MLRFKVPLYLTLGNHEGFPVNAFPTDAQEDSIASGAWLYEVDIDDGDYHDGADDAQENPDNWMINSQ